MKQKHERVSELAAKGLVVAAIAREIGVSRAYVYMLADKHGIALPSRTAPPPPSQTTFEAKAPLLTGGVRVPMNSTAAGTVSELLVAADLLSRGWQPYMPLVRHRGHDLLAYQDDKVISIEVRSARRSLNGELVFGRSSRDSSDHYALVTTGEQITYRPELP